MNKAKYSTDGRKAKSCKFCRERYYSPQDIPTEQYMWEGHVIMECPNVPQDQKDWLNKPWTRDGTSFDL